MDASPSRHSNWVSGTNRFAAYALPEAFRQREEAVEHVDVDQRILFCGRHEHRAIGGEWQAEIDFGVAVRPEEHPVVFRAVLAQIGEQLRRIRTVLGWLRRGVRPANFEQAKAARDTVVAVSLACASREGCLPRSLATALGDSGLGLRRVAHP